LPPTTPGHWRASSGTSVNAHPCTDTRHGVPPESTGPTASSATSSPRHLSRAEP
jgi:hypothetical protein